MHLQFSGRRRRVDALGERDEIHAERLQVLEQRDEVLQAASEPVEPPAHDDIEAPSHGVPNQLIKGRAVLDRPTDPLIDILARLPASNRDVFPKLLELVFDLLVVRAHADVDRCPVLAGCRHDRLLRLFLRKVNLFPPHGLDVGDNFFSLQRDPSERHPGRVYLGICVPGRRVKGTLIRVYVAFLCAAQALYETHQRSVDPWMSLVGYFNSMRELGGMRRLVDDDVYTRCRKMDRRGLAKRLFSTGYLAELTSRMRSEDIPLTLDRLEAPFDPDLEAKRKDQLKRKDYKDLPKQPLEVLLATNMLSVGVDVRRLGLMVVAGQPKATAEYIQATSRVGRNKPGIVCTVYNWARPRDLSHYGTFEHYHGTFYKHVEPLSITPFSAGAAPHTRCRLLRNNSILAGGRRTGRRARRRVEPLYPEAPRSRRGGPRRGRGPV